MHPEPQYIHQYMHDTSRATNTSLLFTCVCCVRGRLLEEVSMENAHLLKQLETVQQVRTSCILCFGGLDLAWPCKPPRMALQAPSHGPAHPTQSMPALWKEHQGSQEAVEAFEAARRDFESAKAGSTAALEGTRELLEQTQKELGVARRTGGEMELELVEARQKVDEASQRVQEVEAEAASWRQQVWGA